MDNNNNLPKSAHLIKFCSICRGTIAQGSADLYCGECHTMDRVKHASYWKEEFAKKAINTLSPQMKAMQESLKNHQHLLQQPSNFAKVAGIQETPAELQLRKEAMNKEVQYDLSEVKKQVAGLLPKVLANLRLQDKVDVALLTDILVPNKIASKIGDTLAFMPILQELVLTASIKLNPSNFEHKGLFGKTAHELPVLDAPIISDGIRRSNGHIAPYKEASIQCIAEQQAEESQKFAPQEDVEDQGGTDVADSEKLHDAEVEHVDEMNKEATLQKVDEVSIPQYLLNQKSVAQKIHMTNEAPRRMSEVLSAQAEQKEVVAHPLKVSSKLVSKLPVESVSLSEKDKYIISSYQPVATFNARFKNLSTEAWAGYKTDAGFLILSDKAGSYHAKDLKAFASVIQSQPDFAGWNEVPDMVDAPMPEETVLEVHVIQPPDIQTCDCPGGHSEDDVDQNKQDLVSLILELLPQIQKMFPDNSSDDVHDLALVAALDILEGKLEKTADPTADFTENVKKTVTPYMGVPKKDEKGNAVFNHIAPHIEKALGVTPQPKKEASEAVIPCDKVNSIRSIIAQMYATKEEQGLETLLHSFDGITPHLNREAKLSLLPSVFHPQYNALMAVANKEIVASSPYHKNTIHDDMVRELMNITADFSLEEFQLSIDAMFDLGYTKDAIMVVAENRFNKEEHRQEKHIEESEEKEGKSPEKAKEIGYATIQKEKNDE